MNYNINYPFERNQNYPADHVYALKPTNVFQGCITQSEINPHHSKSVRILDDAIVVESVDEKTRTAALHHFSALHQMASIDEQHHTSRYYQGITASVLGLGFSVGCIALLPVPSLIGVAVGLALSGLGIWKTATNNTAIKVIEKEIDSIERKKGEWKDPIEEISTQRKLAGAQGFQYVYKNNLKGKVVHEQEVQDLWLNDFYKLISGHQNIKQIFEDNLLDEERIGFGWNQTTLPAIDIGGRHFSASTLKALSKQFNVCRSSFMGFETAIDHELTSLNNQKAILKKEITDLRTRWLFPAECIHAQARQEADHLYENALRPFIHEKNVAIDQVKHAYHYDLRHPFDPEEIAYKNQLDHLCNEEIRHIRNLYDTHPSILHIKRAYESDHRKCDFLFNQSKLVVDAFYDVRLRTLDQAYNHAKMQIEEQQAAGHQKYQKLMSKILTDMENMETQPFLNLLIQRNWNLPNSLTNEPSWNEVYGRIPTFQSTFRNDISELGWNHFWSGNGLGRYASCPTSSWSRISQDRTAFPFKQQWFDLHNVPVRHNSGMFMREVRVPPLSRNSGAPHVAAGTRPTTGFAGTTHREETHVNPGSRMATGFAQTSRRDETHVTPGPRTATGFAGTTRRDDDESHVKPGTRAATVFAGTTRR